LPAVPDDVSQAGEDADGVGVLAAGRWRRPYSRAAHGLAWRESPAKSQTASRSCLPAAPAEGDGLVLAGLAVEGATPAAQISAVGGGEPGASSRRSRAARMVPARGSEVKMWPSACKGELFGDLGVQGLDLGNQAWPSRPASAR